MGGGPDVRQPTPCQSIPYQFGVWSRKGGWGGRFMVRRRQPTPRQSKAVLLDVLMPKGGESKPPSLRHLSCIFLDFVGFSEIFFNFPDFLNFSRMLSVFLRFADILFLFFVDVLRFLLALYDFLDFGKLSGFLLYFLDFLIFPYISWDSLSFSKIF